MQQQAEGVGQEAVTAQTVGAEAVLELLDAILALPAIVVESKDLGGRSVAVGDQEARLVPVAVCSALKQMRRLRGQLRARWRKLEKRRWGNWVR